MIDPVAAAGLERILLDRLASELLDGAVEGPHAAQVHESFAEALARAGGLGLAGRLSGREGEA